MTTFTKDQLQALAVYLARQSNKEDAVGREYHAKRQIGNFKWHAGKARAYQEAAMLVRDLAHGARVPAITEVADATVLPALTASGILYGD